MASKYLKEDASGGYQLEDASGVYALDGPDLDVALTGLAGLVRDGSLRASGAESTASPGTLGVTNVGSLAGLEATSTLGTITASGGGTPDVTLALAGEASTSADGTLSPALDCPSSGLETDSGTGTLGCASELATSGTEATGALGTLTPSQTSDLTLPLVGVEGVVEAGNLEEDGGTPASGDDEWLLRRRKGLLWKHQWEKPKKRRNKYKRLGL